MTQLINKSETNHTFVTTHGPVAIAANGGMNFASPEQYAELSADDSFKQYVRDGDIVVEGAPSAEQLEADKKAADEAKAKVLADAEEEARRKDAEIAEKKKIEAAHLDQAAAEKKAADEKAREEAAKAKAEEAAAEAKAKADAEADAKAKAAAEKKAADETK